MFFYTGERHIDRNLPSNRNGWKRSQRRDNGRRFRGRRKARWNVGPRSRSASNGSNGIGSRSFLPHRPSKLLTFPYFNHYQITIYFDSCGWWKKNKKQNTILAFDIRTWPSGGGSGPPRSIDLIDSLSLSVEIKNVQRCWSRTHAGTYDADARRLVFYRVVTKRSPGNIYEMWE